MIMKSISRFFILLLISIFQMSSAQAADVTFTHDTNVTVAGANYSITSNSTATSVTVENDSVTIAIPQNGYVAFRSPDRYVLTSDYGNAVCSLSENVLEISRAGTFTIQPDTTRTCTIQRNTMPGYAISSTSVKPTTIDNNTKVESINSSSSTDQVKIVYNLGSKTLKVGSIGEPVRELQRFLNKELKTDIKVDGKLGPKTILIIKNWQKKNGLKADGIIGSKTKALINKISF
jgi:hypothetical protein